VKPDGTYEDFPADSDLTGFDKSDRKFAALARRSGVAVAIATDSDWLDFRAPLQKNSVRLQFLCGADREAWFKT
jgi:imidazolonepropionase-like amidohydrolase